MDIKKLNEKLEVLIEEINSYEMIKIGNDFFKDFVRTACLYNPDITTKDKISWYCSYNEVDFLLSVALGQKGNQGRFIPKENEIILFIPPQYYKEYPNVDLHILAKDYLQVNYNVCQATFNHELTHFEKVLTNDSNGSGYKRAKKKGYSHYMKHSAELDSQIVGALSCVDNFISLETKQTQQQILKDNKTLFNYIHELMRYNPNDMEQFSRFRKLKPGFLDKLLSKIKPLGKLLNSNSYALKQLNKHLTQYRIKKLNDN